MRTAILRLPLGLPLPKNSEPGGPRYKFFGGGQMSDHDRDVSSGCWLLRWVCTFLSLTNSVMWLNWSCHEICDNAHTGAVHVVVTPPNSRRNRGTHTSQKSISLLSAFSNKWVQSRLVYTVMRLCNCIELRSKAALLSHY